MFPYMESLLHSHVERTVILNDINQDNNKFLGYEIKKTFKVHRLKRSTEEFVSTFKSVVEAEQRNGGPWQKRPLAENENPTSRSDQEQGMDQYIKRRRIVESQTIAIGADTGEDACGNTLKEMELCAQGRKSIVTH